MATKRIRRTNKMLLLSGALIMSGVVLVAWSIYQMYQDRKKGIRRIG
jgi:hypothetical protein